MLKKLFILYFLILLGYNSYSQSTARNVASACIINPNDTTPKIIIIPILKIGMTYNETINILGFPIEKLVFDNNKQKWIYDSLFVYFLNGKVDIIIPIKKG